MTDKATQFWSTLGSHVRTNVAGGSLRRMQVDSVEPDGMVVVKEVGINTVHDEPYLALASPSPYQAGDYVIVGTILGLGPDGTGSTRVVLGKAGINSPSTISDAKSQATADTASTANVTTFANAITLGLVLPAGLWTVSAQGSVLLSHNVNQGSWRLEIDGNFSNTHTLAMVTENRFAAAFSVPDISGGRTINVRVQFRSFTAGTTTARNPVVSATAVRQ